MSGIRSSANPYADGEVAPKPAVSIEPTEPQGSTPFQTLAPDFLST
jgi:hypothetical protein